MNPVLAASLVSKLNRPPVVVNARQRKLMGYVLVAGLTLGGGAWYFRNQAKKRAEKQLTNVNFQAAASLVAILQPPGLAARLLSNIPVANWVQQAKGLFTGDGFAAARFSIQKMTDWEEALDAYRALSKGRSLVADLQRKLSSSNWQLILVEIQRIPQRKAEAEARANSAAAGNNEALARVVASILRFPSGNIYSVSDPPRFAYRLTPTKEDELYADHRRRQSIRPKVQPRVYAGTTTGRFSNAAGIAMVEIQTTRGTRWANLSNFTIFT